MGNLNDRNSSGSNAKERSGEFGRLQVSARETKEELQEFLGNMRGKSPQEVLGLVAASGLTQGIIWSTLGTIFILVFFTVMPYYVYDDPAAAAAEKKRRAEAAEQAAEDEEMERDTAEEAKVNDTAAKKAAAMKELTKDIDETKGATGDEMPDIDNLLK